MNSKEIKSMVGIGSEFSQEALKVNNAEEGAINRRAFLKTAVGTAAGAALAITCTVS